MKEEELSREYKSDFFENMPDFVRNGLKELTTGFSEMFQSKQESNFLLGKMLRDEQVRESLAAVIRTLLNVGVSVIDAIPGIGEVVSLGVDAAKLTAFDLTPDVGIGVAWGSEILELFTGGAFPSHIVETSFQFVKDYPRMKEGLNRAKEIWTAHQAAIKTEKVQNAAAVFATAPVAA